jgi:single-stranded DNA-binding protein
MSHSVPPRQHPDPRRVPHQRSVLRTHSHDRKVCDMRIAVHDKRDPSPMFLDVATFGAQAEACAQYLTKGRAIAFTGRLAASGEAEDGTRRSKHQAVGRVQFGPQPRGEHKPSPDKDEAPL